MVTNLDDAVIQVKIDTSDAERELIALDDQAAEVGTKAEDARGALGRPGRRRVGRRQGKPAGDAAKRGSGGVINTAAQVAGAVGVSRLVPGIAKGAGSVGAAIALREIAEIGFALAAAEIRQDQPFGPASDPIAAGLATLGQQMDVLEGLVKTIIGVGSEVKTAALGQLLFDRGQIDVGRLTEFTTESFGIQAAMQKFEVQRRAARRTILGDVFLRGVKDLFSGSQEEFQRRNWGN